MSSAVLRNRARSPSATTRASWVGDTLWWRLCLIGACAIAIGAALSTSHPAGYLEADPALSRLLRGMALIKGCIALAVFAAALWRCGLPLSPPVAVGYIVGTAMLAGSAVLIWQLTLIPLAALSFHGAALGLMYMGWRER